MIDLEKIRCCRWNVDAAGVGCIVVLLTDFVRNGCDQELSAAVWQGFEAIIDVGCDGFVEDFLDRLHLALGAFGWTLPDPGFSFASSAVVTPALVVSLWIFPVTSQFPPRPAHRDILLRKPCLFVT